MYKLKSLLFPPHQIHTSLDKAYENFASMQGAGIPETQVADEFERVIDVLIEKDLIEINENEILSKIFSAF